MATTFSLAAIVPEVEPLTFTDDRYGGDGATYTVRRKEEFGPIDLANLQRIQSGYALANKNLRQSREQAKLEQAARDLETSLNDLISLIVVGLPTDRIAAIPVQLKARFLTWWKEQQDIPQGEAKAPPVPQLRTPRGKQSRVSSPVTD